MDPWRGLLACPQQNLAAVVAVSGLVPTIHTPYYGYKFYYLLINLKTILAQTQRDSGTVSQELARNALCHKSPPSSQASGMSEGVESPHRHPEPMRCQQASNRVEGSWLQANVLVGNSNDSRVRRVWINQGWTHHQE